MTPKVLFHPANTLGGEVAIADSQPFLAQIFPGDRPVI